MTREITPERKTAYYLGMGLVGVGLFLFSLPFLTIPFGCSPGMIRSAFSLAFIGFALVAGGNVLMAIGRSGLAGAGIILDPKQARDDVEPFSRMKGGVIKDALDEAGLLDKDGLKFSKHTDTAQEKIIMIRCQSCGKLNEENSKFCNECGGKL
ncbi:MAG: zinc ribbon domain-containing protein [Thermoguttaceae bacterium]